MFLFKKGREKTFRGDSKVYDIVIIYSDSIHLNMYSFFVSHQN